MKVYLIEIFNYRMEMGGIEPPSENPSIKTSPITVVYLKFPPNTAKQQAVFFGSFINLLFSQSLEKRVHHLVDTRFSNSD